MGIEMLSSNSATILSSFAATVSAVAAIYAIKQSILQRRLSYKPQLHIEDYFETVHMLNTPHFDDSLSPQKYVGYYELPLINIGNGAAQNLKYEWEYNFHHAMKKIVKLFNSLKHYDIEPKNDTGKYDSYYHFEVSDNEEFIVFKRYDNHIKYQTAYSYQLQYILPQQHSKTVMNIKLPAIISSIIFNIINLEIQSGTKSNSFSGPKLILSYQDSGGAVITDRFESEFILGADDSDSKMHSKRKVRIKFNKIDSRWTRRLLQKVRKGYTDFMDEHDFNKNR